MKLWIPLALSFAAAPVAAAHADEPVPAARQNGRGGRIGEGWMFRLGIGPALFEGSAEGSGLNSLSVSSTGQQMEFSIGHSVAEDLILQAELAWLSVEEPEVKDEDAGGTRTLAAGRRLRVIGIGPGVTWQFHENVYVSGGIHGTVLTIAAPVTETVDEIDSDIGVSLHGAIGAHWSFDGLYTLGISGALTGGAMSASVGDSTADWTYLTGALRLTASFWPG